MSLSIDKKGFDEPEFVVLLQCTSPIRDEFDIDNAIKKFKKNSYDSLLSVCENKKISYGKKIKIISNPLIMILIIGKWNKILKINIVKTDQFT